MKSRNVKLKIVLKNGFEIIEFIWTIIDLSHSKTIIPVGNKCKTHFDQ